MTKTHFTKTATRSSTLSCLLLGGRPRLYLAPTLHFRCFYLLPPHGGASHHHINHLHIKGCCRKLPTEAAPHGSGPWTPRQSPAWSQKIILAHILKLMMPHSLVLIGLLDLSSGKIASTSDIKNAQRGKNKKKSVLRKNVLQFFSVLDFVRLFASNYWYFVSVQQCMRGVWLKKRRLIRKRARKMSSSTPCMQEKTTI